MLNNFKYKFGIVFLILTILLLTSCSTKNLTESNVSTSASSSASEFSESKNDDNNNGNTVSRKFGAGASSNSASSENNGAQEVQNNNSPNYTNTQNSNSASSNNNNTYNTDSADSSNQNSESGRNITNYSDSSDYYSEPSNDNERSEFNNSNTEAKSNTCSFVVDCTNAINSDKLPSSLREVLPGNGIIYINQSLEFEPGESVFDVLSRITRQNGIPMEFSQSVTYGSKYVEGINSLYEFDCGEQSGWMYKVNGIFPNYGCDTYKIKSGDSIGFYYTTIYGNDLK